jgi:hypothetical protein
MEQKIENGFDIVGEILAEYGGDSVLISEEADLDRPVYIDPGIYKGRLIEWGKTYNPMFKKYSLEMTFVLGNQRLRGWYNIEPNESETLIKAGWKSDLLRMYQEVFDTRLDRRDRIAPNKFMDKPLALEVVSIEKDSNKNPLAKVNHYSRVKKIVGILEEDQG